MEDFAPYCLVILDGAVGLLIPIYMQVFYSIYGTRSPFIG